MKFLVSAASRYGSTAEIAWAIGDVLSRRGFDVSVTPSQEVAAVEEYDAVILRSAVYMGHWLDPAKEFARRLFRGLEGDFPNREEIKAWASGMADELSARSPMVGQWWSVGWSVGRWVVGCSQNP